MHSAEATAVCLCCIHAAFTNTPSPCFIAPSKGHVLLMGRRSLISVSSAGCSDLDGNGCPLVVPRSPMVRRLGSEDRCLSFVSRIPYIHLPSSRHHRHGTRDGESEARVGVATLRAGGVCTGRGAGERGGRGGRYAATHRLATANTVMPSDLDALQSALASVKSRMRPMWRW